MDEELKKLGYDNRSVRSFSDEEEKFSYQIMISYKFFGF